VTSPGTEKLQGMVVSRDIVDFLGGGKKHGIIENKHDGNFLSAVNDSSKLIMNPDTPYASSKDSISDVAKKMEDTGVGGTPIVDKEDRVIGIVTERDFAKYLPNPAHVEVQAFMTGKVVTVEPDLFLMDVMKEMISNGFRRLPVIEDGQLTGIITSVDVLDYFGTNEVFQRMETENARDALSVEVKEIMTKDPVTADPQEDLGEAAEKMEKTGYGGLPVLKDDEIVGIITERDILEILI
ncbi:MAG: CBS domain-containing protein, partial [Candidatus Hadarchaeia archaeon]